MEKLLNLGCGSRFCSEPCWTNIDLKSSCRRVISHDLLEGIPFPDGTFDAVYHSNVLEHFTREDGILFIRECFRVLKPSGVLRVVVPDLEQICRIYLDALAKLEAGDADWRGRYEWIRLEMFDQAVRTVSGGEMAKYLRQPNVPDKEFIIARIGNVGREIIDSTGAVQESNAVGYPSTWKQWAGRVKRVPEKLRTLIISRLLSKHERKALSLGLFRLSGEVHQWVYDKYSLRVLLQDTGFEGIRQCSAAESRIPDWNTYSLDIDPDGFEHAPSALYMEGVKPA